MFKAFGYLIYYVIDLQDTIANFDLCHTFSFSLQKTQSGRAAAQRVNLSLGKDSPKRGIGFMAKSLCSAKSPFVSINEAKRRIGIAL